MLPPAGVDPTRSDRFSLRVAHPAAVDVGDAHWEDRQGAFHGFHVVVLPVEFGAASGTSLQMRIQAIMRRIGSVASSLVVQSQCQAWKASPGA